MSRSLLLFHRELFKPKVTFLNQKCGIKPRIKRPICICKCKTARFHHFHAHQGIINKNLAAMCSECTRYRSDGQTFVADKSCIFVQILCGKLQFHPWNVGVYRVNSSPTCYTRQFIREYLRTSFLIRKIYPKMFNIVYCRNIFYTINMEFIYTNGL